MEDDTAKDNFAKKQKSKGGISRIVRALRYSFEGFIAAAKHESAFRQETATFAVLLIVVVCLPVDWISKAVLVLPMLLILAVELLNSSIEAIVDDISLEYRERAKRAKDFGSAAVFCTITFGFIVWVVVFAYHISAGSFDTWGLAIKNLFAQ